MVSFLACFCSLSTFCGPPVGCWSTTYAMCEDTPRASTGQTVNNPKAGIGPIGMPACLFEPGPFPTILITVTPDICLSGAGICISTTQMTCASGSPFATGVKFRESGFACLLGPYPKPSAPFAQCLSGTGFCSGPAEVTCN